MECQDISEFCDEYVLAQRDMLACETISDRR